MKIDISERTENLPHSFKMHSSMCLELKDLVDRIISIFPDIEDARPGCSSGIQTLCLLYIALEKAKLLLQYCSESSKLYMAVTGDNSILSRACRVKRSLEQNLMDIRSMVPTVLSLKISQIIKDLSSTVLALDSSQEEAGKTLKELMRQSASSASVSTSQIRDFYYASLKLHLSTPEAIVIERRSLELHMERLSECEENRRMILKYLLCLLRKHERIICRHHHKANSYLLHRSTNDDVCASSLEAECSKEHYHDLSNITSSSSLSSLLKIAETGTEQAMITLKNLSSSSEICQEMVSLNFIHKLTSFLQHKVFSKHSIFILRNLSNTEKGRVSITETPGCLASIAESLESDDPNEQENAISIILQLCVQKMEYCNLMVREATNIYSSLLLISNNGTEEAKVCASELLRALQEEDATTSQAVIHQEPIVTTPSPKKLGPFGLHFSILEKKKNT